MVPVHCVSLCLNAFDAFGAQGDAGDLWPHLSVRVARLRSVVVAHACLLAGLCGMLSEGSERFYHERSSNICRLVSVDTCLYHTVLNPRPCTKNTLIYCLCVWFLLNFWLLSFKCIVYQMWCWNVLQKLMCTTEGMNLCVIQGLLYVYEGWNTNVKKLLDQTGVQLLLMGRLRSDEPVLYIRTDGPVIWMFYV